MGCESIATGKTFVVVPKYLKDFSPMCVRTSVGVLIVYARGLSTRTQLLLVHSVGQGVLVFGVICARG